MDQKCVIMLTSDNEYFSHVNDYIMKNHSDLKLQLITSPDELICALIAFTSNVVIVDMEFGDRKLGLPPEMPVAFMAGSKILTEHDGRPVFCKYQSGDELYDVISGLCGKSTRQTKICAFCGAGGGTGTTTVAAAYARSVAMSSKTSTFLSLDRYTDISRLFGAKCGHFSRIVDAAGTKEMRNIAATQFGVDRMGGTAFISSCENPRQLRNIDHMTFRSAFSAVMAFRTTDVVTVDGDMNDPCFREFVSIYADKLYIVADNTASSAGKLNRMMAEIAAESAERAYSVKGTLRERTSVIVNRSSDAVIDAIAGHACVAGQLDVYTADSPEVMLAVMAGENREKLISW